MAKVAKNLSSKSVKKKKVILDNSAIKDKGSISKKEDNSKYSVRSEGNAVLYLPTESKISKDLPVFYNPVMKFQRDLTIMILRSLNISNMKIADPLAGTGVRAIRFLKELDNVEKIYINDLSVEALKIINKNLEMNNIDKSKYELFNEDANSFLIRTTHFDYIEIDPFGSPVPFLDSALKKIKNRGVLAITATDTSSLAGAYIDVCKRRYWANPSHSGNMHEIGCRILIRKVQLLAMQYDKAVFPIFTLSKDHYYRIFFKCFDNKEMIKDILVKHQMLGKIGPLWTGQLWDSALIDSLITSTKDNEMAKLFNIMKAEFLINTTDLYDIHEMCKKLKKEVPSYDLIFSALKKIGKRYSRTHFNPVGIKSDASYEEIDGILKSL